MSNTDTTLFVDVSRDREDGIIGCCLVNCCFPMTVLWTGSRRGTPEQLLLFLWGHINEFTPDSVVVDAPQEFWQLLRCYGITKLLKVMPQ